jgi:nitroreductase
LLNLLFKRRSIRKFLKKEVEEEKIKAILTSGLLAPSSRSRKPWEFIVVTDGEVLQKLAKCKEHSAGFLADAPLGIVVIADPETCDVWVEDCSIASIIMQLFAESLGLGSCWIQVRERFFEQNKKAEDYVKHVLTIPDRYKVECIIAIGYPAESKKPYIEEDLAFNKVHYGRYK